MQTLYVEIILASTELIAFKRIFKTRRAMKGFGSINVESALLHLIEETGKRVTTLTRVWNPMVHLDLMDV